MGDELPVRSTPGVSADLIRAYRETHFRVAASVPGSALLPGELFLEAGFVLQVGQPSAALQALHRAAGVKCSAFITACNPFSQALTPKQNQERMNVLRAELGRQSLTYLNGEGVHPNGQWPGEASVLVLGISREAAQRMGEHWEQNAIVWCGEDAVPELLVREPRSAG